MENKKFEIPELTIIIFTNGDIITVSGLGRAFGQNGDDFRDEEE